MKKLIYIFTGLISLFFALVIIALVFLINLDLNEHKQWLSEQFYKQTGRNLSINGEIQSSLYPWLGIQVEGLEISNPAGFSENAFLQSDFAALRLRLMPLLNNDVEIDTMVLRGTTLNLEVDDAGNNNWRFSDPNAEVPQDEPEPDDPSPAFNQLIIGGVQIDDVLINYVNQQSDQRISASNINLQIPALVYGDPLDINLSLQLSANQPALQSELNLSATANYDLDNNNYALNDLVVDFLDSRLLASISNNDGNIRATMDFNTERSGEILALLGQAELAEQIQSIHLNLQANGDEAAVDLDNLSLTLQLSDATLSESSTLTLQADGTLDLLRENIFISAFTLDALGLSANGQLGINNYSSDPGVNGQFNLSAFDPGRLAQLLAIDLPATRDSSVLQTLALSSAFSVDSNSLALDNLNLQLDDSQFNGELGISNFSAPVYTFALELSAIDLDRYLPPESAQGNQSGSTESSELPLDALRALQAEGTLRIGELQTTGLNLANVLLSVNASGGLIALAPVQAELYQGSYNGSLTLDARSASPAFSLQSQLQNINLEPVSTDFMGASYLSGQGSINLSLSGSGISSREILSALNGSADMAVSDGIFYGVDVGSVLAQLETMIQSRRLVNLNRGEQTSFNDLSASLRIDDGIARSENLFIQAASFNIQGSGMLANLQDNSLDFNLLAAVNPASASLESQQYDIGGYSLPISCTGSISAPRCLPDIDSIFSQALGSAIQEGVGDLLQRVLGNDAQEPNPDEEQRPQNEDENTSPEQQLFNRALERLFQ